MTMLICAAVLAVLGLVLIALPFHVATSGLCLLALAVVLAVIYWLRRKPKARVWRAVLAMLAAAGVAVMLGCVAYIDLAGQDDVDAAQTPEFVVVLGAQTHGNRPSRTLRERLDLAYAYLLENPQAVCFVSGGQGSDETHTEAFVMRQYLLDRGVEDGRIVMEEQARSTRENLMFSCELARARGMEPERVLIITSEFHLCRAKYIARTLGLDACGLGSTTTPWVLKILYEVREVFAFVKAFLQAG